jgi:hypothetical protein
MSKACDGIKLAPVRLADLVKNGPAAPMAATANTPYIIPSKRIDKVSALSPTPLTIEEIKSEKAFPSLGQMKPVTSGASWNQIRARLTPAPDMTPKNSTINYKQAIEQRMLRDKEEAERARDEEAGKDNGHILYLKRKHEHKDTNAPWDIVPPPQVSIVEEEWTGLAWPSENTFLDGRTIDPSRPYTTPTNDHVEYTPYLPDSIQRARNRMLVFIGKKPAA